MVSSCVMRKQEKSRGRTTGERDSTTSTSELWIVSILFTKRKRALPIISFLSAFSLLVVDSHTHNNLRITRILKCLGNLGYAHYQAPLVRFFLEETLVHGQLPNVKESVLNYFVFAVLDKKERRNLLKFAYSKYDRQDEFVWCPKKIQRIWSRPEAQQGMKSFSPWR